MFQFLNHIQIHSCRTLVPYEFYFVAYKIPIFSKIFALSTLLFGFIWQIFLFGWVFPLTIGELLWANHTTWVGIAKTLSTYFSSGYISDLAAVFVIFFELCSYLIGVIAAKMQQHMPNMNMTSSILTALKNWENNVMEEIGYRNWPRYGLRWSDWYCNPAQHELCRPSRGRAGRHNECCAGLQYQARQCRPYKWSISILPRSQFYKKQGKLAFSTSCTTVRPHRRLRNDAWRRDS